MVRRLLGLALAMGVVVSGAVLVEGRPQAARPQDHVQWVATALKRMQTIKPGMTRGDLLKVFTTEGFLSTPLPRTFVSRNCPYFKVNVEFEAVGRPSHDAGGRVTLVESGKDKIIKVSRPYLQ